MPERHLTIPTDSDLTQLQSKFRRQSLRSVTEAVSAVSLIPVTGITYPVIEKALTEVTAAINPALSLPPDTLLPSLSLLVFTGFSSLIIDSISQGINANNTYNTYRSGTLLKQGVEIKGSSSDRHSESLAAKICQLPPVGAKIVAPEKRLGGVTRLPPYLLAEQLVPDLVQRTKRASTEHDFIVQQLTVQGRAKDDFKLVALLLLMHSDNIYDWDQPNYEAPWGKVAPMIHDGGLVNYSLNPVIQRRLEGRTDFLSRVVFNDQAKQDEAALMIEAKAWQRLKLAHDANPWHKNEYLDDGSKLATSLRSLWGNFKRESSHFMEQCQLGDLLEARWFESQPRDLPQIVNYGERYEADFAQLKPGLLKLNNMMEKYPDQLKSRSGEILTKYTGRVDAILGI